MTPYTEHFPLCTFPVTTRGSEVKNNPSSHSERKPTQKDKV